MFAWQSMGPGRNAIPDTDRCISAWPHDGHLHQVGVMLNRRPPHERFVGGINTLSEIARAAGVGRVTLYAHFASRAEVVDAAMTLVVDQGNRALDSVDLVGDPSLARGGMERPPELQTRDDAGR
ncbi:helix-turn-helix domain-containing protein [Streptomyces sp. NPDC005791]|uniref:helix-turn-helix domain-containing protein n=1 Tax=unclassified Streptomyces TaxID=2593676 RepID=UPI0033DEBD64